MVVIHCLSSEASAPPIAPVAPIAAHVPPPKHLNFTAVDVLSRLIVLLVKVRAMRGGWRCRVTGWAVAKEGG